MKKILLIFILLTISLLGCNNDKKEKATEATTTLKIYNEDVSQVVGVGRVEPESKMVTLVAQVAGYVKAIYYKNGDWVNKGIAIFELDHDTELGRIEKIKAQINTQETINNATRVDIERTRLNMTNLQKTFERLNRAYQSNAETKQTVDNAENAFQLAMMDIKRLETTLATSNARIQELKADLNLGQIDLNKRKIYAPANGKLQSTDIAIGTYVTPNIKLGDFAPESPINVITEIDELFADHLRKNQSVYIRAQGGLDTLATGKVIDLAPNLRQKSLFSDEIGKLEDRRVREVRVRLDVPTKKYLLLGTRVECVISVK